MTRSRIQRIKFFVFLLIFLLSQLASCDGNFRERRQAAEPVPLDSKSGSKETAGKTAAAERKDVAKELPAQSSAKNASASIGDVKKAGVDITSKAAPGAASTTAKPASSTIPSTNGMDLSSMNSGALMRGVFVILGLSVLVMAYMVFRSFRLNKSRAQMVRKYGVLAHRQDVEMRPLPLDEDDEDDTTVFDASNISSHRLQSQDS
ncbi:hypothetical protein TSAR_008840 [Trichomalopsis sarcophagae]|uniref:Uncharacterized protein n=1 Tax=Trichomalopsis sarcophagae TaxID=543379 RepID=A0A232EI24_9HYME|nr:hypothetical protein TSAR_008840 [Trichomalopsis sarcophagae]